MAQQQYLLSGRPPYPFEPPFDIVDFAFASVGQTLTLDLSADDEQALIAAGVLEPIVWVLPASRVLY